MLELAYDNFVKAYEYNESKKENKDKWDDLSQQINKEAEKGKYSYITYKDLNEHEQNKLTLRGYRVIKTDSYLEGKYKIEWGWDAIQEDGWE